MAVAQVRMVGIRTQPTYHLCNLCAVFDSGADEGTQVDPPPLGRGELEMEMAKWTQGRYNDHYLRLGAGIVCMVNWRVLREGKNWHARFMDNKVGEFDDLYEAKVAAEGFAMKALSSALKGLPRND